MTSNIVMQKLLQLVTGLLVYSTLSAQSDSTLYHAQIAYEQQDYQSAFDLYNTCFTADSSNVFCCEKTGISAYRLGDSPSAKSIFSHLITIDTFSKTGHAQLASIYEQEKNTPKAIKHYNILKKLFPDNAYYQRKLGQQYMQANLIREAFENYSSAYKLNDKDMVALQGIAEIFLANEQYTDADSILTIGLQRDSLNVKMNQLYARSQYKQKNYNNTIASLEKINGRIDLSPYFNKMLGYSYIQIDSFERSIFFLEKSLMDAGSREYAHYYLATAYENLDNQEYAIYHYKEALKEGISKNVSTYHRNLANIYNGDSNLKEAIPHYQDAYKYNDDPIILFYLARASDDYYKDKNIAMRYYKKYLKSAHKNKQYKSYSEKRIRYLKELKHQSGQE